MRPLTELDLRLALKDKNPSTFSVPRGTLITPSAMEYLRQRRITLIETDAESAASDKNAERPAPTWNFSAPRQTEDEAPKLLFFGPDGGQFDHKPEAFTHLKGRLLVHKDHPIIIWRGKLDSLGAAIIEAQLIGEAAGNQEYVRDLQEILDFSHRLLASELRGEDVEEFKLLGLTPADLRERSHNPVKFYGHKHMLTEYKMGALCVRLNSLRAQVREVELAAAAAFKDAAGQPTRDDIVRALNRLSSLFYIMMFKYLPQNFNPKHSGI